MRTVGELRAALTDCADDVELVLNVDTRDFTVDPGLGGLLTIDPAVAVRVEVETDLSGVVEGHGEPRTFAHLLIGDWDSQRLATPEPPK